MPFYEGHMNHWMKKGQFYGGSITMTMRGGGEGGEEEDGEKK